MSAVAANPVFEHVRLARFPSGKSRTRIAGPASVAAFLHGELAEAATESFFVVALDTKNGVLGFVEASRGTVDASLVHPRDVFAVALALMATSIILVHNHPSGDPEPSPEDIALTRRIAEAGRILGVPLLDHVIVGGSAKRAVSLAERGLIGRLA